MVLQQLVVISLVALLLSLSQAYHVITVPVYGRPDLTVSTDGVPPTITYERFTSDSCDFIEKCVQGTGVRRLLRFTAILSNIGDAPLYLEQPSSSSRFWDYSSCHGHYHRKDAVVARLVAESGRVVAAGQKIGFCMKDYFPLNMPRNGLYDPSSWGRFHTCSGPQGLTNGWSDVYGRDLSCQYLDITNVPGGTYRLELEINAALEDGSRPLPYEMEFSNNIATSEVTIPSTGSLLPPQVPNPTCPLATVIHREEFGTILRGNTYTGGHRTGVEPCGARNSESSPRFAWYRFTGTGGRMQVSTCEVGTSFDTVLFVYTSCGSSTCDSLACVASNDDYEGIGCGLASKVNFSTISGQSYLVAIRGYNENGAFGLNVKTLSENDDVCSSSFSV